jgi:hypothetical protein
LPSKCLFARTKEPGHVYVHWHTEDGKSNGDGCDMKGGGSLSTGNNNGGNCGTGCINRPLHFNSRKNDRNLMEAAVPKLIP